MIWLAQFNFTRKRIDEILNICEEQNYDYDIQNIRSLKGLDKLMPYENVVAMQDNSSPKFVRDYFASLEEQNIKILTMFSDGYPKQLKSLPDCPTVLFCKGDISLLNKLSIAIVGSRKPSNYGRIVTDEFAASIAKSGVVIVSGLAYGVDSIAHRKALEVGGKTIAVLGGGFNYIYPSEHTALAEEIAQKGLLITEYCPSVKPTRYSFVDRNRIIAGLSHGVLITDAGLNSGTRSTKEFAIEYGRDVFAVPGSIKSENSQLPNMLIASNIAKCVLSEQDVLDEYNIKAQCKVEVKSTSAQEDIIIKLLEGGEKDVMYLQDNSGFDIKNLNSYLTMLEIRGIIKKLPGNFYALA